VLRDAIAIAGGAGLALAGLQARDVLQTPVFLALGVALGVPALRRMLPEGTFSARGPLPAAVLARGVLTFSFFCADVFIPLTVISLRGESVFMSVLALMAGTIGWTSGAWIQERTVLRIGAAPLVQNGFALIVVGIVGMELVLLAVTPTWVAVPTWGLAGLGIGMAYSSISLTVLRNAVPGSEGANASAMQVADVLGNALGTGIGAVAVAIAVASTGAATAGVAVTNALGVAIGLIGVFVARRLRAGGET
jgi:hypothetical protein